MESDSEAGWPDWEIPSSGRPRSFPSESLKELSRYVNEDFVTNKGLVPSDTRIADTAIMTPRTILEDIFDLLVDKLSYRLRPWTHDKNFQRIRDVDKVLAEGGTCIDIALLAAATCLSSYLRPYIVFASASSGHHVFLAISAERDRTSIVPFDLPREDHTAEYLIPRDMQKAVDDRGLLLFDSTDVTISGMTFDRLMERSKGIVFGALQSDYIRDPIGYWLVDVKKCHQEFLRDSVPLHVPLKDDSRITTYLPELTNSFEAYSSRTQALAELEGRARTSRCTVVRGKPGVGKSLLALEVARKADHGCGWFLDASSPSTLERSLAAAELAEQGNPDLALLSRGDDRESLARVAIDRLQSSRQPWMVVIDNANGDLDADYQSLLPKPGDDQTLIVTTTNPAWDTLSNEEPVIVEPLEPSDMKGSVPNEVIAATHGLPLLVRATAAFAADGVDLSSLHSAGSAIDTARRLFEIAGDLHPDPQAFDGFVAKAGWLPAAGFDFEQVSDWTSPELIKWLVERGLVQANNEQSAIRIHRTFGEALRELHAGQGPSSTLAILTSSDAVDLLDETTVEELETLTDFLPKKDSANSDFGRVLVGQAFHTLGKIKELHGDQKSSSGYFQSASDWLGDDQRHRLLVADCRHGIARRLFQGDDPDLADLDRATELVVGAQEISASIADSAINPDEGAIARITRARSRALEGLIERKRASNLYDKKRLDRSAYRNRLEAAMAIIDEADKARQGLADDPELARSKYNFAGIYIGLAKTSDTPSEALDYVKKADEVYALVRQKRESIYRRPVHPHIAACVWGLGVTAYYRGLFATEGAKRIGELRLATRYGIESLDLRQQLDDTATGSDVTKSRRLLYKAQILTDLLSNKDGDLGSVEDRLKLDIAIERTVEGLIALRAFPLVGKL